MVQMDGMDVMVMEVENEEEELESGSEELRWEHFMPKMVLRVLLVEADDPTRQIIATLLRKYNYKVVAISDGLKAWEILKRRHNNIDLILTDLDLPSISGYALLTLIMEHDGCKDIPVIVMSSQDSISMVLKCFFKGAADYLIKPVRKNELKNLWRHVWKRLANKTGNNPQNLTAAQLKIEASLEDNPATNHPNKYVSSSWKNGEKATYAQIPCTSHCMEDLRGLSQLKHWEESGLNHKEGKHPKNVKVEETEDKTDQFAQPSKEVNVSTVRVEEDGSCTGITTDDRSVGSERLRYRPNIIGHEPSIEAADLIGRMNIQKGTARQAGPSRDLYEHNSNPELELSLKSSLESKTKDVHERHILNHSNASAFSWYSSTKKPRTTLSPAEGELPNIKGVADSPIWHKPMSSTSESKSNNIVPQAAHQFGPGPLPGFTFDNGVWASNGAVYQPTQTGPTVRSPNSALQREESPFLTSPSLHSDPGTHSSTQACGQSGDELKTRESVERPGYCSSQVVDQSGGSTQCNDFGSHNKLSAHGSASDITEVDGTASGPKGSSFIDESDGCKPFVHDQFRSMRLNSAERQAALAKYQQKRKGRCFEKKVRYQSRKKLADQRPRVKGQFVRRVPADRVLVDEKPQI